MKVALFYNKENVGDVLIMKSNDEIATSFKNICPKIVTIMPTMIVTYINNENILLAFSSSFSPNVFDTRALPPEPNIKPRVPNIPING